MSNHLHAGAIVLTILAIILIIVSIATTSWITGCLPLENIFKATNDFLLKLGESVPDSFDQAITMVNGMKMCIHQGFFRVSMTIPSLYSTDIHADIGNLPIYMIFLFVTSILAVVLCIVATFLLVSAIMKNNSTQDKQQAAPYTKKGMVFVILAGILLGAGMIYYSVGTAHVIHDSLQFMALFGSTFSTNTLQMVQANGLNRGKRDVNLNSLHINSTMQFLSSVYAGMDPVYGYSYILGWVSCIILLLAFVVAAIAYNRICNENYDSSTGKV